MEERLLSILRLALKYGATDIHFNKVYNEMNIEMRIDGEMKKVNPKYDDYKLDRFIKYLACIDVSDLLNPQTNEFEMFVDGELKKLRYAAINTPNITQSVLRILG